MDWSVGHTDTEIVFSERCLWSGREPQPVSDFLKTKEGKFNEETSTVCQYNQKLPVMLKTNITPAFKQYFN